MKGTPTSIWNTKKIRLNISAFILQQYYLSDQVKQREITDSAK